jgi:hypothetical protein
MPTGSASSTTRSSRLRCETGFGSCRIAGGETITNDVSFFKHHRKVEYRNGPPIRDLAPVKKSIYSLIDPRDLPLGCNRRFLAYLSALDDVCVGVRALDRLTKPRKRSRNRPSRGSTSSIQPTMPCCTRCRTRGSTSPVSDAPICWRCWINSPRPGSHASFARCATSA